MTCSSVSMSFQTHSGEELYSRGGAANEFLSLAESTAGAGAARPAQKTAASASRAASDAEDVTIVVDGAGSIIAGHLNSVCWSVCRRDDDVPGVNSPVHDKRTPSTRTTGIPASFPRTETRRRRQRV